VGVGEWVESLITPFSDASNDKTIFFGGPIYNAYGGGPPSHHNTVARRVSGCLPKNKAYQERASRNLFKLFTEFFFMSPPSAVQVLLSTAHPAKFSEAVRVTNALPTSQGFDFERHHVPPQKFRGLSAKERRVVEVDEPNKELVKR
jgi:hypothetical protein